MQVKKQQLEPDMEQWIGSKLRREYVKAVCCHLAYLTSMESTSSEKPGWMIARRNINNLRYADYATFMAKSKEKLKSLFMKVKKERKKKVKEENAKLA